MIKQLWLKFKSCTWYLHTADTPSISNLRVMGTGTTFITISWTSTSVGSVTYTITYSTGDVMMSSITNDIIYTINGLASGTSYRISVVPSVGMCEGEGKEMMVDTNDTLTTVGKQNCIVITISYLVYLPRSKVKTHCSNIAQCYPTYVLAFKKVCMYA